MIATSAEGFADDNVDHDTALGRTMTMHLFVHGRYSESGPARVVIAEAGLDGESPLRRISEYVRAVRENVTPMVTAS